MTRHAEIEKALIELAESDAKAKAALALPEDSKTVNAELYGLTQDFADTHARNLILHFCPRGDLTAHYEEHISIIAKLKRYLSLREASGEPMPYKVVREGDKVRFE